jgi:hypothetical protein
MALFYWWSAPSKAPAPGTTTLDPQPPDTAIPPSNNTTAPPPFQPTTTTPPSQPTTMPPPAVSNGAPVLGRYVRIQRANGKAESVDVGSLVVVGSDGYFCNPVAGVVFPAGLPNQPWTNLTTWDVDREPANACAGSLCPTQSAATGPATDAYVEVDLGEPTSIEYLKVYAHLCPELDRLQLEGEEGGRGVMANHTQ